MPDLLPAPLARALAPVLALEPVVLVIGAMSVVAVALGLFKLWQFAALRVGRHSRLRQGLGLWDRGDRQGARRLVAESRSHLRPVIAAGMEAMAEGAPPAVLAPRLTAEAAERIGRLEGGLRALDAIVQLAPLLGLFGTVLGMIEAFRALTEAGTSVDPTLLAEGIWTALIATAAGLAVAMATTVILTWLESRIAGERRIARAAIQVVVTPGLAVEDRAGAGLGAGTGPAPARGVGRGAGSRAGGA